MTKKYQIAGLLLLLCAAQVKAEDAAPAQDAAAPESEAAAVDDSGAATASGAEQTGDGEAADSSDEGYVFGFKNGYLHAALAAKEEWTDNLYNTANNTKENFLTKISPSVWLTLPRRSKKPLQIVADNTAIGGMQYSLPDTDQANELEAYLAGTIDFLAYSEDSDLNHAEGDIDALVQFKPSDPITLQLLDKYTHSQDIFNLAEATSDNDRVYNSNIFGLGAAWYSEDRFSVKGGYRNFLLEYDDVINEFMNRTDNGFDIAAYYEYSDKTNFFVQYQYLMAEYDTKKMADNDNNFFGLGVNWQATVKTTLMAKGGYQQVDYDALPNVKMDDSASSFFFEAQGIWQATYKTSLLLNSKYSIEQSDSAQALSKDVLAFRLALDHRFTERLRGDVNFVYETSDYNQFSGDTRSDDRWYLKPELQFAVNKWLFLNAYCSYDTKDSNYDALDYDTTTIGFGVRGSF
ncbi:outer membrane beta-barrel protein [Candidatus Electronema sp. JM]|uniref:outer membrane beta-barrel protein n=1 Tax=Candidatus Electronema sp. JM TaxID=3401571 RepID=UPI003AA9D963